MKSNSKIWIPGGSGFVGNRLVSKLTSLGYTNLVITGRELDVTDQRLVDAFLDHNNIKFIFMCCAKVGGIGANITDPYSFLYENTMIQNNIINSSGVHGVKKVIFLGSSCIYPKDYPLQPLKEEYLMQSPLEPTNEGYALAKIAGLKLCEYANKKFPNTHYICLMPSNLYGPGDHFDSINSHALAAMMSKVYFAKKKGEREVTIWGSGKPRREWLFVDDLVDCMLWAEKNLDKSSPTFLNVGTGVDIDMVDLFKLIIKGFDYSCRINLDRTKPDGMMKKCLDVSLINSLGWKAQTSIEDGLKKTIESYVQEKSKK